jgi:nitroreductase
MNLQEAIVTRRSVRVFLEKSVEKEKIEQLMAAAVQAPSAMNAQPWAFAVIADKKLLATYSTKAKTFLLGFLDKFPLLKKYETILSNPSFNIFHNAGTLLIIYSKPLNTAPNEDCSIAAQNVMLAAHELGLGSCWIGFARDFLNRDDTKQELGVPKGYSAVAPLIIGYPKGKMPVITKKAPEILFWK